MLCSAEAAKSGTDASAANGGGTGSLATCVKQELPTVLAALASCKSAGSRDDMKACVAKAIGLPGPRAGGPRNGAGQGGGGQNGGGRQGGSGQGSGGAGNGRGRSGGQQQNRR